MITIEPMGNSFAVYRHDHYPSGGVLAGKARRVFLGGFVTVGEAQTAHPKAEVVDQGAPGPRWVGRVEPIRRHPGEPGKIGERRRREVGR